MTNPFSWIFLIALLAGSAVSSIALKFRLSYRKKTYPVVLCFSLLAAATGCYAAAVFATDSLLFSGTDTFVFFTIIFILAFSGIQFRFFIGLPLVGILIILIIFISVLLTDWVPYSNESFLELTALESGTGYTVQAVWNADERQYPISDMDVYPVIQIIHFSEYFFFLQNQRYLYFDYIADTPDNPVKTKTFFSSTGKYIPEINFSFLSSDPVHLIPYRTLKISLVDGRLASVLKKLEN